MGGIILPEGRYLYALDLSLESTGVVIFNLDTYEAVAKRSIRTNPDETDGERLATIVSGLRQYAKDYPVSVVVMERAFVSRAFNKSTEQLFRVHGVINYLFYKYPQIYYAPSTIKKTITGNGKATKEAVLKAIQAAYPDEDFKDNGKDSDVSDAYAVGLTYLIKECKMPWTKFCPFVSTMKTKKPRKKKGTA